MREGDEFRAGHIPGAVHIPRGHLESKAESTLTEKGARIVLYCAGGTRSILPMAVANTSSVRPAAKKGKGQRRPCAVSASVLIAGCNTMVSCGRA